MHQQHKFKDQVVVVTGASAGIGRAIALAFAHEGAHIGLISRNKERLEQVHTEISSMGSKALILPMDVADHAAMDDAAQKAEAILGPIRIWVNNAMVSVFSPVLEMQPEEYRRVTDVTYLGTVYGTLAALKRMQPRNYGTIIQVGSALAYRGIPLQSAYCAAKHAIQGFHDSLLSELLHQQSAVKVSMVQLSAHNTPQFDWVRSRLPHKAQPVPPIFQPEVAARAVMWAAQHYRREYIVGFPAWKAIYGNHFFPALGDWYLARKGFESQQTKERKPDNAVENLYDTVQGNYSVHGRFDEQARSSDLFFELTKYVSVRYYLLLLLIVVVLVLFFS